jgi:elongation of very long chain fatty acids protein 7
MKNRKPFELRKIIIVYNLFQVILSAKLFYDASSLGWLTKGDHAYNWRCAPFTLEPADLSLRVRKS